MLELTNLYSRIRHPRTSRRLREHLDLLCRIHYVTPPKLRVDLVHTRWEAENERITGSFYSPKDGYVPSRPTIVIYESGPLGQVATLNHEFAHYLGYLSGMRIDHENAHDDNFWRSLDVVSRRVREAKENHGGRT